MLVVDDYGFKLIVNNFCYLFVVDVLEVFFCLFILFFLFFGDVVIRYNYEWDDCW